MRAPADEFLFSKLCGSLRPRRLCVEFRLLTSDLWLLPPAFDTSGSTGGGLMAERNLALAAKSPRLKSNIALSRRSWSFS